MEHDHDHEHDHEHSDDDEEPTELDPREREDIEADLEDLEAMRLVFEEQGVRGVVIACPDCGSNHYYDWDLLRENLEHMLATGEPRMHEPAFEPREQDYVQWDYGKGYVDALADVGIEPGRRIEVKECPWCRAELGEDFTFCPRCGRSLGAVRLLQELVSAGMEEREAKALLVRSGFEPF
jgi:Family of unknown function (DUF5319)/zinc-ribbon domain